MSERGATLVVGGDSDIGFSLISRLSGDVIAHCFAKPEKFDDFSGQAKIFPVYGNLASVEGIMAFVEEIKGTGLEISKIVHLPSAPAKPEKFKNFDEERFARDMNITVLSAALVMKEFLPAMAKRRFGRVAAVLTSYCIGVPPKYISSYVASKYALMGLLKSLAAEYASKGITVNAAAPSMVETSFLTTLPDFEIEANAKASPLGRLAAPDDVARVLEFLISDEGEYLNGAVIPVTAGAQF